MEKTLKKIGFLPDLVNLKYPGYRKILDPILQRSNRYSLLATDDSVATFMDEIIPFGVLKSAEYAGKNLKTAYLIDSVSLGFKSVFLFYLKRGKIFHKELWLNLARFVKYAPLERRIVNGYQQVIVVSRHDAKYLRLRYKKNNIYTLENGVDFPIQSSEKNKCPQQNFTYTLGMLNYWGAGKPHDFIWFIEEILPNLRKEFPGIKILLAGRGCSLEVKEYFKKNNCEFVGEVENLSKFFSMIDIFFTTVRKECGILNKVLDAFAHKKIVLGYEPNMKAFSSLTGGFFTYQNANDMVKNITFIRDNPEKVRLMEKNAYEYVLKNHNWDTKVLELDNILLEDI